MQMYFIRFLPHKCTGLDGNIYLIAALSTNQEKRGEFELHFISYLELF